MGLSLFNYLLWKRHRLGNQEIKLIRIALLVSIVSTMIASVLVYVVTSFIISPTTSALLGDITAQVIERLHSLLYLFSPRNRVEVML